MDIIKHLENAKANIKQEVGVECAIVIEKEKREKIVPFNQNIDKDLTETLNKLNQAQIEERAILTDKYNQSIINLQEKYDTDKRQVVAHAEKQKLDNETAVIEIATCNIKAQAEKVIAKLDAQIAELTKE